MLPLRADFWSSAICKTVPQVQYGQDRIRSCDGQKEFKRRGHPLNYRTALTTRLLQQGA